MASSSSISLVQKEGEREKLATTCRYLAANRIREAFGRSYVSSIDVANDRAGGNGKAPRCTVSLAESISSASTVVCLSFLGDTAVDDTFSIELSQVKFSERIRATCVGNYVSLSLSRNFRCVTTQVSFWRAIERK